VSDIIPHRAAVFKGDKRNFRRFHPAFDSKSLELACGLWYNDAGDYDRNSSSRGSSSFAVL